MDDLKNNEEVRNLWFHGPPWLSKGQENWPKCEIPPLDDETIQMLESKKDKSNEKDPPVAYQMAVMDHDNMEVHPPFNMDISRYSKLLTVLRVTAWCNRFIENCRKKEKQKGE